MKTTDFNLKVSSSKLKENINKMFGVNVNLEKYTREQLEDMRNKLRTRVSQQEGSAGINDLLTNETYQKDKAMLDLLNTRIKEMLGEDIKKLKDKLDQLNEAKKGVRAPKYTKKAKGTMAEKDYDGDGKVEPAKDEVWGSRAKAAAKAGKPFGKKDESVEEDRVVKGRAYGGSAQKDDDDDDEKPTKSSKKSSTSPKGSSEKTAADRAVDKAADRERERSGKDWEARGYSRRVVKGKAQSGSPKDDDDLDEAATTKKPSKKENKAKGQTVNSQEKKQQAKENFKRNVKMVNEGLMRFLAEDEEGKAKAITAASDMVNDFTSWMQRVGQYQTKSMIELADAIRADFGAAEAETFKQSVGPALAATLDTLTAQREAISNAVAVLAGEQPAAGEMMGAEPGSGSEFQPEPGMEPSEPDQLNPEAGEDEFGASDAAAGAGTTGREMRESRFARKLAESHSIISKLSK